MMRRIFQSVDVVEAIVRLRWLWLIAILAASGFFAWQLRNTVLDGSVERILLRHDPERVFNQRSFELFGSDEIITVVLTYEDGVWNEEALLEIQRLTEQFESVEHVQEVFSLANQSLMTARLRIIRSGTVLERVQKGEPIEKLRENSWQNPLVRRNLVSENGRITAINIRLMPLDGIPNAKRQIAKRISQILDEQVGPQRYHLAGWPVVQSEIGNYMERDLKTLLPLTGLVVAVLLWFSFRRFSGVALPLISIALALVWTMGLLAATGRSVSMITNSLPVILIANGTTYCIHVLTHLFREFDETGNRLQAVRNTLRRAGVNVFTCACTSTIGFASLLLSPVEAIDEFGTLAMCGVVAGLVMALVFLPALFMIVPLRRKAISGHVVPTWPAKYLSIVLGHRRLVWAVTALGCVLSVVGISRMRTETAPVNWFPASSEVRTSVDYVNQHLVGITLYNVVIETGEEGGLYDPALFQKIDQFQRWLEQQPEVHTTLSIVDPIRTTTTARNGVDSLPTRREALEKMISHAQEKQVRGIGALATKDGRSANIIIRSPIESSEQAVDFAERVDRQAAQHFGDMARAKITGSAHLAYRTNIQFTNGLVSSLAIGAGTVCLTMLLVFRSWKLGLLALVPNLIPIAFNYALLGFGDLTLNAGTSITGCIAMGMAVDDTIHFLMTFSEGLKRTGNRRTALEHTLAHVAEPMVTTSTALLAGFSVLMLSNLMPISSLGLLVATTMVVCVLCNLVLLPVLLTAKAPALLLAWKKVEIECHSTEAPATIMGADPTPSLPGRGCSS